MKILLCSFLLAGIALLIGGIIGELISKIATNILELWYKKDINTSQKKE